MTVFSLKWGQNLEDRAAHPHQEFKTVPPGSCISLDKKTLLKIWLNLWWKFTIFRGNRALDIKIAGSSCLPQWKCGVFHSHFRSVKSPKRATRYILWPCKSREKVLVLSVIYSYFKDEYTKGVTFLSKMVSRRARGWSWGRSLTI